MARTPPPNRPEATPSDLLSAVLTEGGIELDDRALAVLRTHFDLLLRWNQKINLTAIRDPEQIARRHFLESLFLTTLLKLGPGILYDVGSGAGFPGLPLKAACPELRLVLVESSLKKVAFLKEVIRTAGLEGARVEAVRVEALVERAETQPAEWVTMRAVGRVGRLLPVLRRLLAPRGKVALFLGENDAGDLRTGIGGFVWNKPERIPGSERRVILVGESLPA